MAIWTSSIFFEPVDNDGRPIIDKRKIKHQKYSIHRSVNSIEFNTIKHIIEFEDGSESKKTHNNVKGIKRNLFNPVFSKRFLNMADEKYNLSNNEKDVTYLGSYNAKEKTLVLMLSVTNNAVSVPNLHNNKLNIKKINFSHFKVYLLWGFLNLPSPHNAKMIRIGSFPAPLQNHFDQNGIRLLSDGLKFREMIDIACKLFLEESEKILKYYGVWGSTYYQVRLLKR